MREAGKGRRVGMGGKEKGGMGEITDGTVGDAFVVDLVTGHLSVDPTGGSKTCQSTQKRREEVKEKGLITTTLLDA
jgi:hypothetical protein